MRWLFIKLFNLILIFSIYVSASQYDEGRKICENYWNTKYVNFYIYSKDYEYGISYCKSGNDCEGCKNYKAPKPYWTNSDGGNHRNITYHHFKEIHDPAYCYAYKNLLDHYSCSLCSSADTDYPLLDENQTIVYEWKGDDDNKTSQCHTIQGTIQSKTYECEKYHRCVIKKGCTKPDIAFPHLAKNQYIAFMWNQEHNLSSECIANGGVVQEQRVNCKNMYRCIVPLECPIESDEPISSYVSPNDNSFHEDIDIAGVDYTLHYSSSDKNNTIAYGWMPSVYAYLIEDKLYLGSGDIKAIDNNTTKDDMKVVTYGKNAYYFDTNNSTLQYIKDIYTNQRVYSFGYDESNYLVSITDMYDDTTTLSRDSNHTVVSIEAPTNQITLLDIDSSNNLKEISYEDGSTYRFEYDDKHHMIKEIEPKGNEFLHIFDEDGSIKEVIDAKNASWKFESYIGDNLYAHSVQRASGDTVVYTHNFLDTQTDTLHSITKLPSQDTIEYIDSIDQSQRVIKSCGMSDSYVYKKDDQGKLYKDPYTHHRVLQTHTTITPSSLKYTKEYKKEFITDSNDTLEQIISYSTINSKTSKHIKDIKNKQEIYITPMGKETTIGYDNKMSDILYIKPYGLYKTLYEYNTHGQVTKESINQRETTYTYDSRGNLSSITDAKGRVTTYKYDKKDRLQDIIYPDSTTLHYEYDLNGNMSLLVTPTPANHTFEYDSVNKPVNYTSPLKKTTIYNYDKQRRVTQIVKPSGKRVDIAYTNARVSNILTDEDDINYNYSCQSNISSIVNGDESIEYNYDGTLLTNITQKGILNQTIAYSYNNEFLPISVTYANQTTEYAYNDDNQLIKSGEFTISYSNEDKNIITEDDNYKHTNTLNSYGELNSSVDDVYKLYLTYNEVGQIVKKEEEIKVPLPHNTPIPNLLTLFGNNTSIISSIIPKSKTTYEYEYDTLGRLIKVTKNNQVVEEYSYDANGNRAEANITQQSSFGFGVRTKTYKGSYTLDDNLIVYADNTYRYDDDGYLIEKTTPDGKTTYTYNTLGALSNVILPDNTTIAYHQNALNKRVAKEVNGTITQKYLWADLTTLLAIYDKDDNLIQRFEYANQRMPIAMTDKDNNRYYLHYDQVGSLRAVSDTNHNIIKEITYDTYGNIINDTNPDFKVPFGFAGGLYDSDTKLVHFGYREYDSFTGKWTAKDPIGFQGGDSNLYGYVLGDPVDLVDPMGLSSNGFDFECHEECASKYECDPSWNDWDYRRCYNDCVEDKYDKKWHKPIKTKPLPWYYYPLVIIAGIGSALGLAP